VIPLRISLKGFLSYREEQELLFDGASLWVLAGPNGAGKSAVFDAITYGVFGTCRGMAQNLTELINHHCDALQVEIDFVVNGLVYRVRRTLDRRGSATRGAWCLLPAEDGGAPYVEPITNTDMERGFEDWVKQTIGTFETFTSSVLLQQGDSEKLLRASPKERYAILAEIIDLAPYQRLSERVEGKRTEAKRETNDLQQQLTNAPVVSDDDLIQAATVTLSATSEHQMAQQDVERLVQVFTQAGEWERLQKDLATNHRELAIAKQLLERADEIETGYARLQELEGVLPILKRITAGRLRLSQKSEDIISLHAEITGLSAELFSLEQVKELAEAEESKLLAAQNQAHKDSSLLSDQLAKLAPLLAHGDRYEHVTQERDKAQRHLLTFPEDLPTDVERAEEELNYLTDVQTALSWLQPLYERRDALVRVNAQEQVAADGLTALYDEVHQKESRQEALDKEIVLLQRTERALHNAAAAAQDRYDQVIERLDTFSQIAEQPV
jgi:DNA repair exonuclease SbcCD ATPase subunit